MKIYNEIVIDIETGGVLYEDSCEYDGDIALCKGDVEVPGPTEEEKALTRQQTESLAVQMQMLEQQQAQQEAIYPYLLQDMGYKQVGDEIIKMTDEEKFAAMTPLEQSQYDLSTQYQQSMLEQMPMTNEITELALERQRKALAGELEVSPALEEELARQEEQLEEQLSRRLGPNWKQTTPGIQALSKMKESHELLREEARRGEIASGQGLALAQQSRVSNEEKWLEQLKQQQLGNLGGLPTWNMPTAQGYGQLSQLYGQAQQPYQRQRQLETQALMQSQANKAAGLQGILGLGGSLAMAGGMFWGG